MTMTPKEALAVFAEAFSSANAEPWPLNTEAHAVLTALVEGGEVERLAQAAATALYGREEIPPSNSLTRAMMLLTIRTALTAALQQGKG